VQFIEAQCQQSKYFPSAKATQVTYVQMSDTIIYACASCPEQKYSSAYFIYFIRGYIVKYNFFLSCDLENKRLRVFKRLFKKFLKEFLILIFCESHSCIISQNCNTTDIYTNRAP
jgi:hypothetical protein